MEIDEVKTERFERNEGKAKKKTGWERGRM